MSPDPAAVSEIPQASQDNTLKLVEYITMDASPPYISNDALDELIDLEDDNRNPHVGNIHPFCADDITCAKSVHIYNNAAYTEDEEVEVLPLDRFELIQSKQT